MTSLDNDARRIREAFDEELAAYHAPAGLAARARQNGQRRARNRRLPAIASLAGAAAAAISALALMPAGSAPAGSQATLSAFTVTRYHDTVDVNLRQLAKGWSSADRAALQRKLRADGVPAIIGMPRVVADACTPSPLVARVLKSPDDISMEVWGSGPSLNLLKSVVKQFRHHVVIKIHTEKIPPGDQVGIAVGGNSRPFSLELLLPGFLKTPSGRYLC